MPFQGQAVPILVGVASWSFTSWQKQKYERKQQELNQITEQIRNFYGPLSGNRLVYNSSYVCVTQCKHVSMYEWLEAAQENIFKWFYLFLSHFVYSNEMGTLYRWSSSPVRPSGPGSFGQFRNDFRRGDHFSQSDSLMSVGNVKRKQNGEYTSDWF